MGCNCGNKGGDKNFLYTAPNGSQKVYTSEIQAKAAKIRNKGGNYVPVNK